MFRFLTVPFQSKQLLDHDTRKLKNALKHGLEIVENAVEKEMESSLSKVSPSPLNNADILLLIKKHLQRLHSISSDIERQGDKAGLLRLTRDLLVSEDDLVSDVLNFTVAMQLSELILHRRSPLILEDKNLQQLKVAAHDHSTIIDDVRNEVERNIRKRDRNP